MKNTLKLLFILLTFGTFSNIHADKNEIQEVNSFVLLDFAKLKQSGMFLRTEDTKKTYNNLAEQANSIIDAVIFCIKKGRMSKSEEKKMDTQIKELNNKILTENKKNQNLDNKINGSQAQNSAIIGVVARVYLLLTTSDIIQKLISYLKNEMDKYNFIEKLEEQKWKVM